MSVSTASLWLKCASAILMILGGIALAIGAHPATSGLATLFADAIIWPFDGAQSLAGPETRLFAAIGGGITAGWGVLVWLVAGKVLPDNPALGREILVKSLMTWFAVELDLLHPRRRACQRRIANLVFLLAFLYPLWRMERQDFAAPQFQ